MEASGKKVRNAFGRRITGAEAVELGGRFDEVYRLAMEVVSMGDLNAVDVAHATHEALLQRHGCMSEASVLKYGFPFPKSQTVEVLYIDDHIVVHVCDRRELMSDIGPDKDLVDASHAAYVNARLVRAEDKAFGFGITARDSGPRHADPRFQVLGAEVLNEPGTAAAPLAKRAELMLLTLRVINQPYAELTIVRRDLASFIHPCMHRRQIMSVFHRVFRWLAGLTEHQAVRWPADIREELLVAALLLPLAEANIRWGISSRLTTTDATPIRGEPRPLGLVMN